MAQMKTIHRILIGVCWLTLVNGEGKFAYDLVPDEVKTVLNNRVGVDRVMGGNITLISVASNRSGRFGFVCPGKTENNISVAIKFSNEFDLQHLELKCYYKMDAMTNIQCEKYGVPFIYHTDTFYGYKTMAMTWLDTDLWSFYNKTGPFSKETILIVFRDMIRTMKYIHSKGIIHQDIKPNNIMIKGANVFICDFNQCDERVLHNPPNNASIWFMSIDVLLGASPAEYDDMQSLFYAMLQMGDVELPWHRLVSKAQILKSKQLATVEDLCSQLTISELVQPYKQFYTEVMEAAHEKRLPKYDELYRIFDDALYNGRNRSQRIVFEWLSDEEKRKAMMEDVPSIESIVFPQSSFEKKDPQNQIENSISEKSQVPRKPWAIEFISTEIKSELIHRVGVEGAFGDNITLTSIIPLGSGRNGFLYPGKIGDSTPVAIKFSNDSNGLYQRELRCYDELDAINNKECMKYGIPFIYHTYMFFNYKTMVMTMLDTDLRSLHNRKRPFSKETILIIFRDTIRTLKYIHSKGIIHEDIKPDNIMVKGASVFVCDFNKCNEKALHNPPNYGSKRFMSIAIHMGASPAEYDDMESLFYTMLELGEVELPWSKLKLRHQILESKQHTTVENLCSQLNIPELVEPYTQFHSEVVGSAQEKRLPKYDELYKIFDDALYKGRNRSQRIVFEWLSDEEKRKAMTEDVPSIESIVFPQSGFEQKRPQNHFGLSVRPYAIELITEEVKSELIHRVGVEGAMGNNITLTSIIPLGSGKTGFLYPGKSRDNTSVAIKFLKNSTVHYIQEVKCYERMGAMVDKECVKYGIPFIYHTGMFLNYKTVAMTMLDTDLRSQYSRIGPFSKETVLIIFRDTIRTLKYIHSKDIIHGDIKPDNIMVKGANVFVCDFNKCNEKSLHNPPNYGSRWFRSISVHMGASPAEYDDMESLFYTMLELAEVELPWRKLVLRDQILESKQRATVESLCSQLTISDLIQPYTQYYTEVMEAAHEKRLPKYDELYRIFDDALYNGRNRSQRIVFEWLSDEEKLKAMTEDVPSIGSILFSQNNV